MKMKIEAVSPKDLDSLYKIEQSVFKENAFSKDVIEKLIKDNFFFLKLEKGTFQKKIIGSIITLQDRKDRVNIINILLRPEYQHKGYGSLLLKEALNMIKTMREIKKVILNVRVNNYSAIKLYKKHGFKKVSIIKNYYTSLSNDVTDAFLMELESSKI